MIQSMTGFGKGAFSDGAASYSIVIRSVNSKTADVSVRLPSDMREWEFDLKKLISTVLKRGKIDLFVTLDSVGNSESSPINNIALKANFSALKGMTKGLKISQDTLFKIAARMPNAYVQERGAEDENRWKKFSAAVEKVMEDFTESRKEEGAALEKDIRLRIGLITSKLESITGWEKERSAQVRKKLESQLSQVNPGEGFNRDRFEQELIYYFEKSDITEEKVRLTEHCRLFLETLSAEDGQGRKLGFISQEIGREINTIGSKAGHVRIQQAVVEMKDELEKVKEQLFNIL